MSINVFTSSDACPECGSGDWEYTVGSYVRKCSQCGSLRSLPARLGTAANDGTVIIKPSVTADGGQLREWYIGTPPAGPRPGPVDTLRAAEAVRERIVRALETEVRDRSTAERLAEAVVKELGKG